MRKLILGILFAVMFLTFVTGANTITLISPATNGGYTPNATISATMDTNYINVENVTFYYRTVSGTGAWTRIGAMLNTTINQTIWNTTLDIYSLDDSPNYEFNATAINATGKNSATADTNTGIDLDNGLPTVSWNASSQADASTINCGGSFELMVAPDQVVGIQNCTFTFPTKSFIVTGSANNCSRLFSLSEAGLESGDRTYYVIGYDGNGNNTQSTSRTLTALSCGGSASPGGAGSQATVSQSVTTPSTTTGEKGIFASISEGITNFFNTIWNAIKFWD